MKSKTGSHPGTLWLVKLYLFWEEGSCSMIVMSSQKITSGKHLVLLTSIRLM